MTCVFRGVVAALGVCIAAQSCGRPSASVEPWTVRFGPVIEEEGIVGRVVAGRRVWLATSAPALVRIDLDAHRYARNGIRPLEAGEQIWGLGDAGSPGLWTLAGFQTLALVGLDGRIGRRITLAEPHGNVLTGHGGLLYQRIGFEPGAEAILAGPPGDAARRPWGTMRARDLPLPRAQAALLNMVSCGPPGSAGIPCWFPDRPVVTWTTAGGVSKSVALEGIEPVAPEALFASAHPARAILDAVPTGDGALVVLSRGEGPVRNDERPGGWWLGHHGAGGELVKRIQLPEPARLILGVTNASCLLLSWNGLVVEVSTRE